ncbi:type I-E CRISPR-associated protein Cse1/CasA [Shewanella insulae]|uniref:type I-E CRISPR-associated protein Cse1/CasA n=1 Tax=Shewanella insulae TaxID=2681496 RepID=UPI001EFCE0E8|nr:type I-E CRISPR-associated protein Cse1/CasA [Shewanella insulae]MCG9757324.1 type I-E CRISPR-associated protein Cse1/CasA [Shewanella insulae]
MNLLTSSWMPFKLKDGSERYLPVRHIADPQVLDFAQPRADFQGAAYQFAIGLLQTLFAPKDKKHWYRLYQTPPTLDELQQALSKAEPAFELIAQDGKNGPLFMQDFEPLSDASPSSVSGLLIEAPGGNTLKQNTDHFVKRGIGETLSPEMAAIALFTLQINAPSGGQGHRTGLRGGGPLTTLLLPNRQDATLWQKLWLNVISGPYLEILTRAQQAPDLTSEQVFPWLAPTRLSKAKGSETYAEDVHPLHMYWAMPRRIRLLAEDQSGVCSLTGRQTDSLFTQLRTQNYGYNYAGQWLHPLTPYRFNPKKPQEEPFSIKAQPGGLGYRHWHTLLFDDSEGGVLAAPVIKSFNQEKYDNTHLEDEGIRLWAFGFDMDNMKARGWYSVEFPYIHIDEAYREAFLTEVKSLLKLASEAVWHLRTQIKAALFERPSEAKGDLSHYEQRFWQQSQQAFFAAVEAVKGRIEQGGETLIGQAAKHWLTQVQQSALAIFDDVVTNNIELGNSQKTQRKILARRQLTGWLFGAKEIKNYQQERLSALMEEAQ